MDIAQRTPQPRAGSYGNMGVVAVDAEALMVLTLPTLALQAEDCEGEGCAHD